MPNLASLVCLAFSASFALLVVFASLGSFAVLASYASLPFFSSPALFFVYMALASFAFSLFFGPIGRFGRIGRSRVITCFALKGSCENIVLFARSADFGHIGRSHDNGQVGRFDQIAVFKLHGSSVPSDLLQKKVLHMIKNTLIELCKSCLQ